MKVLRVATVLAVACCLLPTACASSLYLSIVGIPGENPTPGYPDAMQLQYFTITTSNQFSVGRNGPDGASVPLLTAAVLGTPLASSTFLLYDGAPSSTPDATLSFGTTLVSGIAFPVIPPEVDTFAAVTYGSMFLYLPGITGESNTPGYANVMEIFSLTFGPNTFSVLKDLDSASPQLFSAAVLGTNLPTAALLFYSANVPNGTPDAIISLADLLVSGVQVQGGGGVPQEEVQFAFSHIQHPEQPVPEPATALLCAAGVGALASRRKRR